MEAWILSNILLGKHVVADYYVQMNFMFKGKHKYGAWGGIAHSGVHGLLTALCFTAWSRAISGGGQGGGGCGKSGQGLV